MRFLCIYKPAKPEGAPPTEREMAEMGRFIEESTKSGILLSAEGCMPTALGTRVKLTDGKVSITDGPFSEAKELIGGFAIVQFDTMKEAVEYTKRFLAIAGDGVTEVRQLYDASATDQVACAAGSVAVR